MSFDIIGFFFYYYFNFIKIAPAIATGNTIVAKPSELTPMTANVFAEICQEGV